MSEKELRTKIQKKFEEIKKRKNLQQKQIKTVKCCKSCKFYQPEPVQPWEEGLNIYMCYKYDKRTEVDNYCSSYESKVKVK